MTTYSVTEIGGFKRCRRSWHLQSLNRLALQPMLTASVYLDLGTLIHKSLASWIIDPKADLVKLFTMHSSERMNECKSNYKQIHGFGPSDRELDPLFEAIDMGLAMMENYKEFHKTPLPANMVNMAPEQEVTIPVKGTEHDCPKCDGTGIIKTVESIEPTELVCENCSGTGVELHFLGCTFDGLLVNTHGVFFILEHKTYGRRPNRASLDTTDQFVAYMWAFKQLALGDLGGMAYDGMLKKKAPGKSEKLSDLFVRTILQRSNQEMDEYGRMLPAIINDMASMPTDPRDPRMYFNRRWEGCYDCKAEPLCIAMSRDEDWEYLASQNFTKRVKDSSVGPIEVGA